MAMHMQASLYVNLFCWDGTTMQHGGINAQGKSSEGEVKEVSIEYVCNE